MVETGHARPAYMPLLLRRKFLETYYAEVDYGKLHIWTHERIASNGWFEYAWWDRVNSDILVDMQENLGLWKDFTDFLRTHDNGRYEQDREPGAHLWWTAHNSSLEAARQRNDRYFRLMPLAVQERTGLMIEGALAWQIDGLRPWSIPSKWMRIFM